MTHKPTQDIDSLISPLKAFLGCETPNAWIAQAQKDLPLLLTDHANCEKKAAGTALSLIFRYTERPTLLMKMSKLAREELRHFEQVMQIMRKRNLQYKPLKAGRYASELGVLVSDHEPEKLIDKLIMGAFIEARSCERFAKLAPYLEEDLKSFYLSLLKSEARHYQDYLRLAQEFSNQDIAPRVAEFRTLEADLVRRPDPVFRFHSGPPV